MICRSVTRKEIGVYSGFPVYDLRAAGVKPPVVAAPDEASMNSRWSMGMDAKPVGRENPN